MADESREFKIRITGEASSLVGASRQSAEALKETAEATKKGAEATKEHGESFVHAESKGKAFKKTLHELTAMSPEFGAAFRLQMDVVAGSMMLGISLIERMKKSIENLDASLQTTDWPSYATALQQVKADLA